eukprot:RCo036138
MAADVHFKGHWLQLPSKERIVADLTKELQSLDVAQGELRTLRDNKAVYQKRGNVFFLCRKEEACRSVSESLSAKRMLKEGTEAEIVLIREALDTLKARLNSEESSCGRI